ncbi:MAG: threonine--tRNA ligase [Phycisphaeraceae bacterium]|nr:threonine--tRNA ligase [Phycisphaeraceae bacterium]
MDIRLPDGSVRTYDGPVTAAQVAADIGPGLAKAAIGARIDGALRDVDWTIDHDAELAIVTRPRGSRPADADALYLLRHSCAHVLAEAIESLWPETQLAYGPPLDQGYYYDLALDTPISSTDFPRIEKRMQEIIEEDRPFTRYELPPDEGIAKLETEGNKYKVDNARRALDGGAQRLSWYVTGTVDLDGAAPRPHGWDDLCMGPHLPSTGRIGAFKVMSVATSHWHGDVESDRFQRVYGTAFFSQEQLDAHLEKIEAARQRDHRVIGARLGLFAIDDQVGQGLILWKPKGAIVRDQLQQFISRHLRRQGYQQVFTPHIGKLDLYKTSGHYPYYQESQYPPLISAEQISRLAGEDASCGELSNLMDRGEIEGYLLKPMNCPHHVRIYASEKRSYRDLPVRLAEFGTVYRWEQSGELSGMTRVRGFTQDDAHLFCTEQQLADELRGCLDLVRIIFSTLDMTEYRVRVGLRDPDQSKYVGEADNWSKAEDACREAAEQLGVPFSLEPGEAAFYGPKIDFVVKDALERDWQLGTIQVDYNLPIRFDLGYIGADNQRHRPVMIHRAPFGSMERFIGVLIEHFAGAFPLWLSPEQLRILPISDKFLDYARKVYEALCADVDGPQLRGTIDDSNERVNAKIKTAQEAKVPYMLVVGGKDEAAGTVSVRERAEGDLGAMPLAQFIEQVAAEINSFGKERVKN